MCLLELREFAGDADYKIGKSHGLIVVIGDGEDVDFERTGCERRKFVLGVRAEDRLRADNDHLGLAGDLTGGADGMLQLVLTGTQDEHDGGIDGEDVRL
jgi:hypothetical protein